MAIKCTKCNGYIPDLTFGSGIDRLDCKCHIKPDMTFKNKLTELRNRD